MTGGEGYGQPGRSKNGGSGPIKHFHFYRTLPPLTSAPSTQNLSNAYGYPTTQAPRPFSEAHPVQVQHSHFSAASWAQGRATDAAGHYEQHVQEHQEPHVENFRGAYNNAVKHLKDIMKKLGEHLELFEELKGHSALFETHVKGLKIWCLSLCQYLAITQSEPQSCDLAFESLALKKVERAWLNGYDTMMKEYRRWSNFLDETSRKSLRELILAWPDIGGHIRHTRVDLEYGHQDSNRLWEKDRTLHKQLNAWIKNDGGEPIYEEDNNKPLPMCNRDHKHPLGLAIEMQQAGTFLHHVTGSHGDQKVSSPQPSVHAESSHRGHSTRAHASPGVESPHPVSQGHHGGPVESDPHEYVQGPLASSMMNILAYVLSVYRDPLLSDPARLANLRVNEPLQHLFECCRSLKDLFSDPRERRRSECSKGLEKVYLAWAESYQKTLEELQRLDNASAENSENMKSDLIMLIDTLMPCMGNKICRGQYAYENDPYCQERDVTLHAKLNAMIMRFMRGLGRSEYYLHYNVDKKIPATTCGFDRKHIVAPVLKHPVDGATQISWNYYVPPTEVVDSQHTGRKNGRRSRSESEPPDERPVRQRVMS